MTTLPLSDASDTWLPSREVNVNTGAGPDNVCAANANEATRVPTTRTENARNMPTSDAGSEKERDPYGRLDVVGSLLLSQQIDVENVIADVAMDGEPVERH